MAGMVTDEEFMKYRAEGVFSSFDHLFDILASLKRDYCTPIMQDA